MAPRTGLRTSRLGAGMLVMGLIVLLIGFFTASAEADKPEGAGDNTEQVCSSALQGDRDADLVISTDPVGGTAVHEGDTIGAALSWADGVWDEIDTALLCLYVDGTYSAQSVQDKSVEPGDSPFGASFLVPAGSSEVCVHGKVSGEPGEANTSDDSHKSNQVCFPVTEPTTTTTEAPTTTTTVEVLGGQVEATTTTEAPTEVLGVQVEAAPEALATTGVETSDLLLLAGLALLLGGLAVIYGELAPVVERR